MQPIGKVTLDYLHHSILYNYISISHAYYTMVPSLLTSAKCDSCNIPGAAKGKDEYGHIHCRMCSYRKHDDFKKTKRTEPAKGDLWNVYCYRAEKDVTVSERVPDDNHEHSHPKGSGSDDAPAAFRAPGNIFR